MMLFGCGQTCAINYVILYNLCYTFEFLCRLGAAFNSICRYVRQSVSRLLYSRERKVCYCYVPAGITYNKPVVRQMELNAKAKLDSITQVVNDDIINRTSLSAAKKHHSHFLNCRS